MTQPKFESKPPGKILKGVRVEKIPVAKCKTCGRTVYFDTDGNGRLIAKNKDGTRHGCRDA